MKLLVLLLLPCLSLSEVVPGFCKCKQFFFKNDPPRFTPQWGTSVKEICQCLLNNNNKPNYFYATLYNTAWKIPIYSAYKIRSPSVKRSNPWYIEPQLDGGTKDEACMEAQGHRSIHNQAVNDDYVGSNDREPKYDKGHLYPVQHTNTRLSMLATSTLTNAAPQNLSFNRGAWNKHEENVIKYLKSCTEAYVVTGVVPDLNIPKLNDKVTVSKYYWRATCCVKKGVCTGQGYMGPYDDGTNKIMKELTIEDLQTKLATDYGVNTIVIFPQRKRQREKDDSGSVGETGDSCNRGQEVLFPQSESCYRDDTHTARAQLEN